MIKDRILQFLDYKGLSKNKFYIKVGLSNGFLDKGKDIGASKIEDIYSTYPEINLEWLITGKGEMLKAEAPVIEKKQDDVTNKMLLDKIVELSAEVGGLKAELKKRRRGYDIAAES